jgi:hypothetical protein
MTKTVGRGAWGVGVAVVALSTGASAQTSLSIYRDGRVVVRQTLPRALERGRTAMMVALEAFDPATLFSPDTAVTVLSARAYYPSTKEDALARAVGQTLSFVRGKGDTIRATVLSATPPQYRLGDGWIILESPGEPLFPLDLVGVTPGGSAARSSSVVRTGTRAWIELEAVRARPRTELAYVAQGVTWEALYQVILTGVRCQVSGTATVTSRGLRADSAEVQLVAGSIRLVRAGRGYAESGVITIRGAARAVEEVPTPEEAVGETHVYQLPGRLTLEPGVPVATALFPRSSAPVVQELVVPGVLPWRGWIGQMPEPNRVPVQVWYTVKRAAKTPFGDRPLPGGTVQLYQADSAGRAQLVGEATIDHTAPGRDVRVQSGDAFDVTAERVQTDFTQEQIPPPRRGMPTRQRATAAYRVTITNAKAAAVTVDVREMRWGVWKIVESSIPPEKLSATEMRFRIPVPPSGEATLTYTVQIGP